VRKIISILITLGLVLALTAVATPAAGKVSGVTVAFDPDCACVTAAYNVTFTTTASLTEGVHCVCVKFPDGTTVPATGVFPAGAWKTGDILIDGMAVFAEEITVTGTEVCFLVPKDLLAGTYLIEFTAAAGIKNPCTPGKYRLEVYTCREPDSTPVLSSPYYIIPCYSSYTFLWDSGDSYPGIAKGFVPPFKACGQNSDQAANAEPHYYLANAWMNAFDLFFMPYPEGCVAPCGAVDFYMSLIASPQFPCAGVDPVSTVTLNLTGPGLTGGGGAWNLTYDMCTMTEPLEIKIGSIAALAFNTTLPWQGYIHFDVVGEYTICFWAECPGGAGGDICDPYTTEDELLVETCFDFDVHQWKDVGKITLDEKWNLISLPLVPFDTDIGTLLASLPAEAFDADLEDDLVSIWHYDRCADEWFVHGNGQTSLTDMVDGASYWVRMTYPDAGNFPYTWYVWGTARAMPPAAPSAYAVCAGWNMFGFTSLTNELESVYLWNHVAAQPLVYGWNNTGSWLTSGWLLKAWGDTLVSGQGFWGAFPAAGTIIP
jgi:hypothetical protein